jgi:hypothetical protein
MLLKPFNITQLRETLVTLLTPSTEIRAPEKPPNLSAGGSSSDVGKSTATVAFSLQNPRND